VILRRTVRPWIAVAGIGAAAAVAGWEYHPSSPTIDGTARAQAVELLTDSSSQSLIPLPSAVLRGTDDSLVSLVDKHLKLAPRVRIRFSRSSQDTLFLTVTASAGRSAGCITRYQDVCGLTLGDLATIGVLLPPQGVGPGRFLFPYRAVYVGAGDNVTKQFGGTTPLLLSGDISVREHTVFGDTFTAASRTLRVGEAVSVSYGDTLGAASGAGIITVHPGDRVTDTTCASAGSLPPSCISWFNHSLRC